ncbi:MAG TPA: hypothetical protein VM241_05410 [Candidatus Thermoplasmatota archaeon]|nr:hypothetical protein [Candidatus Thermoplasmatota archaeon]
MQHSARALLLAVALVAVSSFFGLVRTVEEVGWQVYGKVWGADFWGDLAFTAGTAAAALAVAVAVRRLRERSPGQGAAHAALLVPVAFLLNWAVYAVSWGLTGSSDPPTSFFTWSFANFGKAWAFTLQWGWPGLLFCAGAVPAGAAWLEGRRWVRAEAPTASAG